MGIYNHTILIISMFIVHALFSFTLSVVFHFIRTLSDLHLVAEFASEWNRHNIRLNRIGNTLSGCPNVMYYYSHLHGI